MKRFVLAIFVLIVLTAVHACRDTDVPPTTITPLDIDIPSTSSSSSSSSGSNPGVIDSNDSSNECDLIGLERRNIEYQTNGLELSLFVPADNADYVRVWTPEVNHTLLGQGPIAQWFSVKLPGYGTWRIKLAVEKRKPIPNQVWQCDRHWLMVTARPPATPPPPPPPCVGDECSPPPPPPPPCDQEELASQIATAESQCEQANGQFTLIFVNTVACTFSSACELLPPPPPPSPPPPPPCQPTGEPECEEQVWDFDTCQWVGECPVPQGSCFYNVPGSDGQQVCFAVPGAISWNEQNHLCELAFPGISDDNFNLNPGQSAEGCLSKND